MSIINGSSRLVIPRFKVQPNPDQPLSEEWLDNKKRIEKEIGECQARIKALESKKNDLEKVLLPRIRYVISRICQGDEIPKGSVFVYQLEHVGDLEWSDWVEWKTNEGWWSVRKNQQRFENDHERGLYRFPTKWLFEDFEQDLKERVEKRWQFVEFEELKRKQSEEEYERKKQAAKEKLTKDEQELLGL